tara:strand:- start:20278 stop:21429 length:1152 start_codon:yes stop_codon:yes gene_type:complete
MKVSILTNFPFPNGKATANRIKVIAEKLIDNSKVEFVEIFCCSNEDSHSYMLNDSIQITNLKINTVNKNKFFIRAINELILAFRLYGKMQKSKSDLTIITVPSLFLLVPLIFKPIKNIVAIDVRDAVWTYFGNGFLSDTVSKLMVKIFYLASKSSKIISVTNVAEYEEIKDITGRSSIVVANGISKARLNEMQSIICSPQSKNINLAYIGNVGIAQEIDQLLDFSRKIDDLKIKIIGDGAKLLDLKHKCIAEKIDNVIFTGFVPHEKISKHLKDVDILFAQIGAKYRTAVPTKIFEYIASGRKVLLGLPKGPAKEIFSKFYGVEIFDAGDESGFIQSYNKLVAYDLSIENKQKNIDKLRNYHLREENAKVLVDSIMALNITKY